MKAAITLPKVENVFMAAVQEWNEDLGAAAWYVFLINDSDNDLEQLIVVSKAYGTIDGELKKTSLLRHVYPNVPAISAVKIELVSQSVLELTNEFMVTYFIGNTLYDKKFIFRKNTINEYATEEVPILWKRGVVVK